MNDARSRIDLLTWYSIVLVCTHPKTVGITQGIMARHTGRGIWLATLVATLLAAVLLAIGVAIMRPIGANLSAGLSSLAGPWLGRPVAVVEAVGQLLLFLAGAYTFVGHVQHFFLFETPFLIITGGFAALSMIGVLYGFEVIARMALVGAVGQITITLLLTPGVIWDLNALNLWPVNELGWNGFALATGTALTDLAMPVVLALAFYPALKTLKGLPVHSGLAMLFTGVAVSLWSFAETMVLGPALTAQHAVSCMTLARAAAIGTYIHRYELIMVLTYLPGLLMMGALPFYGLSGAVARVFGVRDRRKVILPLGILVVWLTQKVMGNRLWASQFFTTAWPLAVAVTIPALLLLAGLGAFLSLRRRARVSAGT